MAIQTLLPYDINTRNADSRTATSVGQALEGLVGSHLQKMQQARDVERNAKGYQEAWNLSPQQAAFVANQSPEFQQELVKALQAQQQTTAFERAIHPERYSQSNTQQIIPQQPSLQENMGMMNNQQPLDAIAIALQKGLQQAQISKPSSIISPIIAQNVPQQASPQSRDIADIFANRPLSPQLAGKAAELELKKQQHQEKLAAQKEERVEKRENLLRKDLNDISKHAQRAKQDINALKQIKVANDSGQLIQGQKRKLLEQFGLQDYFTNTSTQYVAKNIERMVTGATEAFGTGRLTNFLAESYSKALPRLVNTKEGMDLLIKNLTLEKQADIALNDEIRKLKSESREAGKPLPFDIEDQARDRIQPKLDSYQRESLANIEKALGAGTQSSFESLPKAADYSGKTITDTKTGTKYKSNGSKWVKV